MIASTKRRFPITLTIVSLFGGVVVVLLGIVLTLSFLSSLRGTLNLVAEMATQSSAYVVDELRDHLDPVVLQGDWTAALIAAPGFDSGDTQRLGDTLLAALAATPQVTGLVYLFADGDRLAALRGAPGEGGRIDEASGLDADFVARTLDAARQTRVGFWNEILYGEQSQRSYVNYVMPVWRGEQFDGAVLAGVSLNELSVLVSEISYRLRGTVFVLADKDRVIAHPNLTSPHPELSVEQPTVAIDRVGDFVLNTFWSAQAHPIAEELNLEGITIRQADVEGQRFVFSSTDVAGYGNEPWIVGAYLDAETAEAELRALRDSAVIGLVAIVIGALIAVFVGRAVARPIKSASSGIAHIAELEIADVKPLPPSRLAELDAQASAFNTMLGALRWFETYVPRTLVRQLMRRGQAEIVSETRDLTVLFTDLVSFTSASEAMSAEETAELLNDHFALLGRSVEAEAGTIDKFIGDALMAFWGAPEPQDDHAACAVRAARAMALSILEDNERRRAHSLQPIRMRLGLHSGPVVVGNIGAPGRMNYTVVGDTVNTAQRMESLGKEVAPQTEVVILASEAVVDAAGIQEGTFEEVGDFVVKGRSQPLKVYRIPV